MTALAVVFLVGVGAVAAVDWWAVSRDRPAVEYFARPLVIVGSIGLALAVDASDDTARGLVIAALGASLVGDVALVNPDDSQAAGGLAALVFAHLLFAAALADAALSGSLAITDVGALVAGLGGFLLLVSDGLVAWNRHRSPGPGGRTLVQSTCHLGQIGLVLWLAI